MNFDLNYKNHSFVLISQNMVEFYYECSVCNTIVYVNNYNDNICFWYVNYIEDGLLCNEIIIKRLLE